MDPPIPLFVFTKPQQPKFIQIDVNESINNNGNTQSTWSTTPHFPKFLYINKCAIDTSLVTNNIILIPTPYDYSGFNKVCVDGIINNNEQLLNVSFDMLHQRSNVVIWRGKSHSEVLRNNLVVMSQEQQQHNDSGNTQIWLDARFCGGSLADNVNLGYITPENMTNSYKYHLDVGGCSGTSWGGLRWKMCTGNLVFRIETSMMDWWYNTLHYPTNIIYQLKKIYQIYMNNMYILKIIRK
jgi:hypothetical protein